MRKLIKVLIITILISNLSCNQKQKIHFNQNFINSISEEDKNYPSRFFNLIFFCKCQNEEILFLNIDDIKEIYLKEFKDMEYKTFLTKLFNQRIKIHCAGQKTRFKINEIVKNNYLKLRTEDFVSFYCEKKRDNLFWLKTNFPEDQKNTVLYFLFINNYLANVDDYKGVAVIKKL